MIEKTEIIWDEEGIADIYGTLPLKEGDKFYYSVREFHKRCEDTYKTNNPFTPTQLTENYLKSVLEKCDKFHIKEFVVTNVTKSLREDYSQGLNDPSKLHEFYTSITVEEA